MCMTRLGPSSRIFRSLSVMIHAISIIYSVFRSNPVISRSTQIMLSVLEERIRGEITRGLKQKKWTSEPKKKGLDMLHVCR